MNPRSPAACSVHKIMPSGCVTAATQTGLAWHSVDIAKGDPRIDC